jgi:hypothetical protein
MLKFLLTIVLALAFGALGFYQGMIYGGNNGCFEFLGMGGYEACGMFYGILGLLGGALMGLLAIWISKKKKS